MNKGIKVPKLIRWIFVTGIIFLVTMTLLRIGLFVFFNRHDNHFFDIAGSLFLGLRYDLRIVCILLVLMLLIGAWKFSDPFISRNGQRILFIITGLSAFILVFFYIVDFAHYSYLSQRLSASVLNYLEDAGISSSMIMETYPVLRILLALIIGPFVLWLLIKRSYKKIAARPEPARGKRPLLWFIPVFLLLAAGIFGSISQYPLRWSDAFALGSDYKANLSLNPFQSFFSSLKFRRATYDISSVRKAYPLLKPYFGFTGDSSSLDYDRAISGKGLMPSQRPNVVVVICESFSAYKSSMWGNPLNTTPFFNKISQEGIFFDHCFTPSYGTARGVWAVLTGIPDVGMANSTTSRNPAAVDQHSIMNDFRGYRKYYFLGGSSSWANIRGLITNNIEGLHLFEQENYSAPKVDVWGISDKNLFLEANKVLKKQKDPFFAIIQTADNHRPYTIPAEDTSEFKTIRIPIDSLRQFGFESNEEMNAFRYTDFCYEKFIKSAQEESYFDNTLFVFVGDHGIAGNAGQMFPKAWTEQRLTNMHVPLLMYSPKLLKPRRIDSYCSQIDLLPTVAGLAAVDYHNTTLGRDLLDSAYTKDKSFAFTYDPDQGYLGLLMGSFFYRLQLQTGKEEMNGAISNEVNNQNRQDSLRLMASLTKGIYETARYMLLNNKKKR